jgi:hypothetical protein
VLLKLLLLFGHTCVGKLLKLDVYQLYDILLKLSAPFYLLKRVLPFVPILLYLLLTYCTPMKKHQYQVQFQLQHQVPSLPQLCTPQSLIMYLRYTTLLVKTLYSSITHSCTPQTKPAPIAAQVFDPLGADAVLVSPSPLYSTILAHVTLPDKTEIAAEKQKETRSVLLLVRTLY